MGFLSDYFTVISQPAEWNCAHTPVEYEVEPVYVNLPLVGTSGGYLVITWTVDPPLPMADGDMVYISGSQYEGWHTIRDASLYAFNQVTLETSYDGVLSASATFAHSPKLSFDIYKGYRTGEGTLALRTNLPFTLIGSFYVEINTVTISYKWDVSAFLKSIFTIPEPSAGINYSLFNRFRLELNAYDDILENYQVGNCAIDNPDFNDDYAQTGAWLAEEPSVEFECGITLKSKVNGGVIVTFAIVDGDDTSGEDFNPQDFYAGINKDFKFQTG